MTVTLSFGPHLVDNTAPLPRNLLHWTIVEEPTPREIRKARRLAKKRDTYEWHGHRIVSEEDFADYFGSQDPHLVAKVKRRRKIRHGVVLTLIILLLGGMSWLAIQVIRGDIAIPGWEHQVQEPPPVCPDDTRDYMDPGGVTVNVYNSTLEPGFARTNADALAERGFQIGTVSNAQLADQHIRVLIISGREGLDQAFTVQKHFNGARVVLDGRDDDTVDAVLGEGHKGLKDPKKINDASGVLACLESGEHDGEVEDE